MVGIPVLSTQLSLLPPSLKHDSVRLMYRRIVSILVSLASLSQSSEAYSFKFENTPSQCGVVNISITGSGGSPPYRLGIVPWGGSPLKSGLEIRKILDFQFNDSRSVSFTLPYPQYSQFVAIVSIIPLPCLRSHQIRWHSSFAGQ